MKIFVPSSKDVNPYLDEILNYTKNEFVFDDFRNFKTEFQIVNIHWPESLFGWEEPTEIQLNQLEEEIKRWKLSSKLIYTFHDERSHSGMTPNYLKLFDLIETNADAFIHLGEYSKIKMLQRFPKAAHHIIFHPLYENSFQIRNKLKVREKLKIDPAALVIMAPGRIRSVAERNMVLRAFKSISRRNKVLISNNMLAFHFQKDFRGRVKLKRFIDVNRLKTKMMYKELLPPMYIFNFSFTGFDEFSDMMSAADLVFIPRINVLNSGNIFLGLSYKKIIVGPRIGNVGEFLSEFNFPFFNPSSKKSIKVALKQGVKDFESGVDFYSNDSLLKYHPKKNAGEMDSFFETIIR